MAQTTQTNSEDHDFERWTVKRRSALVLLIERGEATSQAASRQYELTVAEIEDRKERLLASAENALRLTPLDEEAVREAEIKRLKQNIKDLVTDIDVLKGGATAVTVT